MSISKEVYDRNEHYLKALLESIDSGEYDALVHSDKAFEKLMKKAVSIKIEYEMEKKTNDTLKSIILNGGCNGNKEKE